MSLDLSQYRIEASTHLLKCRHQIGRNGYNYTMPCFIIGRTKGGKLKIVVFGDRARNHDNSHKKIRYVYSWKLKAKEIVE